MSIWKGGCVHPHFVSRNLGVILIRYWGGGYFSLRETVSREFSLVSLQSNIESVSHSVMQIY